MVRSCEIHIWSFYLRSRERARVSWHAGEQAPYSLVHSPRPEPSRCPTAQAGTQRPEPSPCLPLRPEPSAGPESQPGTAPRSWVRHSHCDLQAKHLLPSKIFILTCARLSQQCNHPNARNIALLHTELLTLDSKSYSHHIQAGNMFPDSQNQIIHAPEQQCEFFHVYFSFLLEWYLYYFL